MISTTIVTVHHAITINLCLSVFQSYRRRFNGATLLPDQEKLYLLLSKAKQSKEKTNTELKKIEEESMRVQDRHAELLVQQRNLQELIEILKVRIKVMYNILNIVYWRESIWYQVLASAWANG